MVDPQSPQKTTVHKNGQGNVYSVFHEVSQDKNCPKKWQVHKSGRLGHVSSDFVPALGHIFFVDAAQPHVY